MNLLDRIFHRRAATVPLGHPSTLSGFYSTTSVTPDSALAVSSVFACVKVVAESVASLPLKVYRRTANGKDAAPNHSLYPILHDLPNSELTSFELREMLMGHVLLRGNAYCEIEMNGRGDVIGLWPLQPNRVTVSRAPDGKLIYTIDVPGQGSIALPQDRVWHIRGFSTNGLIGQSPISIARNAISVAIAGDDAAASLAGNAANPGGVLTYPGKLSDEAYKNVLDSWQNRHQGLGKAGRTALLEQGMDYKTIGISLADQQFLETRKFQRSEVASLFRVPPHMIGDLERATFSNIEHQSIDFVVHTLRPWLVRIEQSITRDLIGPLERSRIFAQFNVDGLLRGDIKSRYEAYHVARNDGWLSANDIRHLEDLNSVDNGDVYWQPVNMADAGKNNAPTQRAFTIAMRDAMSRILRRELQDVGRKTNVDMQKFEADHRQFVAKTLGPVVRSFAVMLGKEESVDDYIKAATEARLDAIHHNKIDETWLEAIDATVTSEVARLESLWT